VKNVQLWLKSALSLFTQPSNHSGGGAGTNTTPTNCQHSNCFGYSVS